ncbi:hypothetical protein BGZ96_006233 [Linnemannia gamsii]|uniref:Uncharacterized protein n=1 Tax=Linnemannia gamsii TaxID=64522 RepID=A0ABQ7KIS6_9FUNG|nr:hypothetical protein BGZ96_006233 [Linnemannia gamsii]
MLFPDKLKTKRSSPLNPNSSNSTSSSSPPDFPALASASTPTSPSPLQQELEPAGPSLTLSPATPSVEGPEVQHVQPQRTIIASHSTTSIGTPRRSSSSLHSSHSASSLSNSSTTFSDIHTSSSNSNNNGSNSNSNSGVLASVRLPERGRTGGSVNQPTRDRILMPNRSSITIGIANSQGIGSSSRSTSSSSLSRLHSLHQTDSNQTSGRSTTTPNTSRDSSPKPGHFPSPPTAAATAIPTRRKSSFDNLGSASGTSSAASSFESGRILRRPSDQFSSSYQSMRQHGQAHPSSHLHNSSMGASTGSLSSSGGLDSGNGSNSTKFKSIPIPQPLLTRRSSRSSLSSNDSDDVPHAHQHHYRSTSSTLPIPESPRATHLHHPRAGSTSRRPSNLATSMSNSLSDWDQGSFSTKPSPGGAGSSAGGSNLPNSGGGSGGKYLIRSRRTSWIDAGGHSDYGSTPSSPKAIGRIALSRRASITDELSLDEWSPTRSQASPSLNTYSTSIPTGSFSQYMAQERRSRSGSPNTGQSIASLMELASLNNPFENMRSPASSDTVRDRNPDKDRDTPSPSISRSSSLSGRYLVKSRKASYIDMNLASEYDQQSGQHLGAAGYSMLGAGIRTPLRAVAQYIAKRIA